MSAQVTQTWQHTEPADADQQYDLQLLTIGGVSVLGRWAGAFGEYFVGWSMPVPKARLPYMHQTQDSNQQHKQHKQHLN